MAAYATAHGHAPDSDAGQLQYLVYDPHTAYPGLVAKLNAAPDPATAATMFETSYEQCSGVTGYMQVIPGSLCMDEDRRAYALAALHQAGTSLSAQAAAIPVALTDNDSCASTIAPGGYVNPFAHTSGLIPQRIDMGVDYDASGELDAIGAARVTFAATGIGGGWVCNTAVSGGIVYQLLGGQDNGRYIYTTEDIIPAVHAGQNVTAGQPIATFTPDGCIETGFSSQPGVEPQAIAYGQQARVGDAGANRTDCGQQMSNLLVATGAPSGLTEGKPITGTSC